MKSGSIPNKMFEIIKSSKYFKISLGINGLMLALSFVSTAFFSWFNNFTWYVFLGLGGVVLIAFLVLCIYSLVYIFTGKAPLKHRLIPLLGNISVFILFPLIQSVTTEFLPSQLINTEEIVQKTLYYQKETLQRDLLKYFNNEYPGNEENLTIDFELLRDGPTVAGVAWPKYYLWVKVSSKDKLHEGAARVAFIDEERFEITDWLEKEEITKDTEALYDVFPEPVVDKILEKLSQ